MSARRAACIATCLVPRSDDTSSRPQQATDSTLTWPKRPPSLHAFSINLYIRINPELEDPLNLDQWVSSHAGSARYVSFMTFVELGHLNVRTDPSCLAVQTRRL